MLTIGTFDIQQLSPEVIRKWAYDTDAYLIGQDEDGLLDELELLPTLVELAEDSACPKRDYIRAILAENCRAYAARGSVEASTYLDTAARLLERGRTEWSSGLRVFVVRPCGHLTQQGPLSPAQARELATDLLEALVQIGGFAVRRAAEASGCALSADEGRPG